jgi:hypothetical protein
MADTRKTDKTEHDAPEEADLGTAIGTGLLELARNGRLSDATTQTLSDAFDPKPEPSDDDQADEHVDRLSDDERRELAEFRAARDAHDAHDADADKTPAKATAGTTKGASK